MLASARGNLSAMNDEWIKCENCERMFFARLYYESHGSVAKRRFCDQQCRTDAKIEEVISTEEIARRARIIRELRESGVAIHTSLLDWFSEPKAKAEKDL